MYVPRSIFCVCMATAAVLLVAVYSGGSAATNNSRIADAEASPSRVLRRWDSNSVNLRNNEGSIQFDQNQADRLVQASKLMKLAYEPRVYLDTVNLRGEKGLEYLHGQKRVIVAKYPNDNVCYVAFRGTVGGRDIKHDLTPGLVHPRKFSGCGMRTGYYRHWSRKLDLDALDQAVNECEGLCENCPLVLTGHSLGGAIAVVASIHDMFRTKDPDVITFGAPAALVKRCGAIDVESHYRFIMSQQTTEGNAYDFVPALPGVGARHYGRAFVIGRVGQNHALAYVGDNDNKKRKEVYGMIQKNMHNKRGYKDSIVDWRNNIVTFPVQVGGYPDGTQCKYGDECASGRCAGDWSPFHCKPKKGRGRSCWKDSMCEDGLHCNIFRKCDD